MKHRQNTYTNKPLAINEGKHQWMIKAIIAILFLLLINNIILRAEGTSSIAPSTNDEAALFIGAGNTGSTGGDYGEFAWKGSNSKLSFNIQNTCERVYFGFSAPKRERTFSSANVSDIDYSLIFRIVDPQGNPINDLACFGNKVIEGEVWQTLGAADINLSSRAITDLGPANLRSGGYIPFELDLSACGLTLTGDYSIEFYTQRINYNPNRRTSGFYIEYFDVTVANCVNQEVKGRLWSNNWGFAIKNDGDGPFDRAFNGAFYICSQEGFISKINFNTGTNNRAEAGKNNDQRSGFRAGAFNVSLNTTGPYKSGNIQTDRQSVWSANATNPELAVFLNLPDPAFCPPQTIGAFRAKNKFLSGCPGDYCINVAFSKPGQVELLIEASNGNRKFDSPAEVRLVREVVEADRASSPEDANYPYEICIPWSGRDGVGNFVDFTKIFISGFYFQGIYHFPVYDAEFNDDGFTVETVRPALGLQELFYDDRQILADNLTGESKDGTNGCDAPCHRWTGEYVASADQTQIFGNFNTVNTWWFANSTFKDFSLQPGLRPAIVCPPDYTGCPGDDISPNRIGNAEVSTSNPECTVINYEDRVLAQGTNCSTNVKIERKWSVYLTGLEGDRIECVQIITLEDESAPTLVGIPADETVRCNAIPIVANNISANDGCNSLAELTIAFNEERIAGNCAGNYEIKRSWTATDQCGNRNTATQTITVIDDSAPVLAGIPQNITVSCDAIPAAANTVSATDNCEASAGINIAFEEILTAGTCAGNYTITRRWIARDACGNSNVAEQIITVTDNSAPVFANIPVDATVSCDAIPVASNTVSATDNCEASESINIAFQETLTAGSCTGNYTITRSWTARDQCGNESIARQIITVVDNTAPVLENIPANQTVACDAIPTVPTTISATDNCEASAGINIAFEETLTAGTCAGNYTITRSWTATDGCGNSKVAEQIIKVVDNSAPVLMNIPADETVACDAIPVVSNAISATDNCEATDAINIAFQETITAGACTGNYTITRSWTATDNCGNASLATQTITVIDIVAPVLVNIPTDETVSCDAIPAVSNTVSATDNCEATDAITITFEEIITAGVCAGNYTITRSWTATDACGNSKVASQGITVIDDSAPVLMNMPADETVSCDAIPAVSNVVSATDNCEANENIIINFEETILAGNCVGNYTISRTWTTVDKCGNSSSDTQTILVEDKTNPVLANIPENITVSCDAIPAIATSITATDNCTSVAAIGISMEETKTLGACTGSFTLARTWQATDACGNQSESTQIITVVDNTAPILLGIPADTTVNCHSIPMLPENIQAMDNCSPDTSILIALEEEKIDGDCSGNFSLKRTWTATDACGNQTIQAQLITVIDTVAPILSGIPDDITVSCEAVPVSAMVTATDNCESVDDISVVFKELRLNGNCEGNYILKRAWTAIDKCGNINFGEQLITVEDTTAPVFVTCPSDTTVLAMEDCNSAVLTIPIPEIIDNCNQAARVISSVDLTQPFPMGTTVVIFTAIDDCGNTNTCEFLVTVKNAPQDNCPADIRVTADNCDNTAQTAIVSWEPPTGNECCSACPQNTDLDGFIFLGERGGHRYYYAENELNWLAANRLSDDLGGYLVAINDPEENTFLNSFLVENSAYIGLSDQGSLGEFYWQNEAALNYTNWADNAVDIDPEETQVAQLSPDGGWHKTDGTKAARFILEIPCMDVIQLTGPLNGSTFPIGTTNITYLIDYDNCANADTCSFNVTVDSCQIVANLGQYCRSIAADTTCFWIEKVIVDQTENESGNNGGYGDFTNLLTPLFKGLEQTLVLNPGYATGHTFNVYWKVWIDFNQDGVFDIEELIFTTKEYRPVAVNFTIPTNAKLGHTRMRIALNFVDENDPCSLLAFGEVEDYLVNITDVNPSLISNETTNESRQTTSFQVLEDGKYPRPIAGVTPMEVVAARAAQLVVFPNPASKQLTVQIEGVNNWLNNTGQQNYDLFIYNQIGQVVKQEKLKSSDLKNTRIDVANLAKGIYFIQVQLGGTKILKQKFLKMED